MKFCISNPEFFSNFPKRELVLQERERILKDRAKGTTYTIIVCEDGVYTIET